MTVKINSHKTSIADWLITNHCSQIRMWPCYVICVDRSMVTMLYVNGKSTHKWHVAETATR